MHYLNVKLFQGCTEFITPTTNWLYNHLSRISIIICCQTWQLEMWFCKQNTHLQRLFWTKVVYFLQVFLQLNYNSILLFWILSQLSWHPLLQHHLHNFPLIFLKGHFRILEVGVFCVFYREIHDAAMPYLASVV